MLTLESLLVWIPGTCVWRCVWTSRHWSKQTNLIVSITPISERVLTEAGGLNNSEYSNLMCALLTNVKKEIPKHNHLSSTAKLKAMTALSVGWENILREAEDLYKSMTAEGYICWSPDCNSSDTIVPPNHFGANLTQFKNGKQTNGTNHTNHLSRKTESTRTDTVLRVMVVTTIVTTRRSLGTEGTTRMLGKLNLLTRLNLTNTLDKSQSTRRK